MNKRIILWMAFFFLSAAGWVAAQNQHITPITTSVFIYSDTPAVTPSPIATPSPGYGPPPVWSTPIIQRHTKAPKRRKVAAIPKATPAPNGGKVISEIAQH